MQSLVGKVDLSCSFRKQIGTQDLFCLASACKSTKPTMKKMDNYVKSDTCDIPLFPLGHLGSELFSQTYIFIFIPELQCPPCVFVNELCEPDAVPDSWKISFSFLLFIGTLKSIFEKFWDHQTISYVAASLLFFWSPNNTSLKHNKHFFW